MVGGLLERLEEVIDELADFDVDTLTDCELDELVIALGPSRRPPGSSLVPPDRALGHPPGVGC